MVPKKVATTKYLKFMRIKPQTSEMGALGMMGVERMTNKVRKSRLLPLKRWPNFSTSPWVMPTNLPTLDKTTSSTLSAIKYNRMEPTVLPNAAIMATIKRYQNGEPWLSAMEPASVMTKGEGMGAITSSMKEHKRVKTSKGTISA